ncbi:MAG: alpha/beta fold hydrolase [Chloroflexota bacterium]|nr:alpha/beta fold hydrolase [Chloroflexota bacterium]
MSLYIESKGVQGAPTIVFLHGAGVSSWMWTEQIEALASDFHTLAIDLPGNGESYQTEWRSFDDSAAQVADIIRQRASGGKAHIVGLSLGGYVALSLLEHHAEVVESVLVSGVTARPLSSPQMLGLMRLVARLQSHIMYWRPLVRMQARMMNLPDEVIPLMLRDTQRLSAAALTRIYDELLPYSLPARLHSPIARRLLAVAGEAEVKAIVTSLPDFLKLTPSHLVQARFAPKAHHAWPGELPDLFTRMIRAWVTGAPLPGELLGVG